METTVFLVHLVPLLTGLRRACDRLVLHLPVPVATRARWRGGTRADAGQATAEYALVLLGAAVIAIALITWATGSGRIGDLFDAVFDELQSRM
jgi:Flp pilus assembly pilin Flp